MMVIVSTPVDKVYVTVSTSSYGIHKFSYISLCVLAVLSYRSQISIDRATPTPHHPSYSQGDVKIS